MTRSVNLEDVAFRKHTNSYAPYLGGVDESLAGGFQIDKGT